MKFQSITLVIAFCLCSLFSFAKENTDSVKVYGNCESCKTRIEKAAKEAGAATADWNDETQMLTLNYDDSKTSLLAIEKKIASVGHDTKDVKATNAAYSNLHKCCQYDRTGKAGAKACDDKKEG